MNSKVLLIMAHGSRREAANDEFRALVAQIAQTLEGYREVRAIFLELAVPDLAQACAELAGTGEEVTHIDLYPLFFNQGKHVERDIPAQIAQVQQGYPQLSVRQLPYFGSSAQLAGLVVQHIDQVTEGGL
jgi:sirohydrochlorin ferrochelatase